MRKKNHADEFCADETPETDGMRTKRKGLENEDKRFAEGTGVYLASGR